ncbi:FMN-binding protein [Streptomyces blattellae]|uniref:FMN-binding protein n=1 Tax=Streptomyces blattellae TaxID=2569855 RepID=UPI0012B715E8
MKRALPVLALTIAGLVPVWRYAPSLGTAHTAEAAPPASAPSSSSSPGSSSGSASSGSSSSGSSTQAVAGSSEPIALGGFTAGTLRVEVTFEGEKMTAVKLLEQPPPSPQTTEAVPKLIEQTLQAQSADIDTVSGATITSGAYKKSLQAALDAQGA